LVCGVLELCNLAASTSLERVELLGAAESRVQDMLSHCANPQCSKPFLRLREGRLFLMEAQSGTRPSGLTELAVPGRRKPPRRVEYFWLCEQCALGWTLIQHETMGVALVPLNGASVGSRVRAAADHKEVSAIPACLSIGVAKSVSKGA
jgi:hypothetical protein